MRNHTLDILAGMAALFFGIVAVNALRHDDVVSFTRVYLRTCALDARQCIGGTVRTPDGIVRTIDDCRAQCGLNQYDVRQLVRDWRGKSIEEQQGLIITLPSAHKTMV